MGTQRQNIQLELALTWNGTPPPGASRVTHEEGIEAYMARSEPDPSARNWDWCLWHRHRFVEVHRTAMYGPVRTVVWERRGREAPPDQRLPYLPDLTQVHISL